MVHFVLGRSCIRAGPTIVIVVLDVIVLHIRTLLRFRVLLSGLVAILTVLCSTTFTFVVPAAVVERTPLVASTMWLLLMAVLLMLIAALLGLAMLVAVIAPIIVVVAWLLLLI